jgi:hypothetical protein
MTDLSALRTFLSDPDRKAILSLAELEKRCGIPATALVHFRNGKRNLPAKYVNVLSALLAEKFGYASLP